MSKKTFSDTTKPEDSFFADFFVESALYGMVLIVTRPPDGGKPYVLKQSEYTITVTKKGEVHAEPK